MRVLVSGHGYERPPLDAARRTVAYDRLILLTTRPDSKELATLKENESLAGIDVQAHAVDPDDYAATLAIANQVLEAEKRRAVTVHVAGGPNLVTSALLLASFQRGVRAFFCHERGVSQLPVIRSAAFIERFDETQRHILTGLSPSFTKLHEELVPPGGTVGAVRTALRHLKTHGLVEADAKIASLTTTGEYYREHLIALRARKSC